MDLTQLVTERVLDCLTYGFSFMSGSFSDLLGIAAVSAASILVFSTCVRYALQRLKGLFSLAA